jgi:outer membrane protein
MKRLAGILPTILGAIASPALAQTQPFTPVAPQSEWTVNIGAGGVYGFSPTGGKADRINATPWADFNWRDRVYGNPLDGLGYNVVKQETVRAGVQIRPHYSGASDLEGLARPDLGADLAAYGFVRLPGNVSVGGRIMRDVSGQTEGTDYYASASNQMVTRVGLLQSTAYLRGGNGRSNNAYFGIDADAAAATGLPAYRPGSGLQNVGVAFLMLTPVGDRWAIATLLNAERAVGDVADSPLIQAQANGEWVYRGAILVIRRFGGS